MTATTGLNLRIYPDPVLFRRAENQEIDESFPPRIRRMFQVMYDHAGIGLAGPQVGWSARIFVVNLSGDPDRPQDELVFVNPRIVSRQGSTTQEEGCLSLPEIRADVTRPDVVQITAQNLRGEIFELSAFDMLARCIQHEYDHLDGILFITLLSLTTRLGLRRDLKELERKFKDAKRAG